MSAHLIHLQQEAPVQEMHRGRQCGPMPTPRTDLTASKSLKRLLPSDARCRRAAARALELLQPPRARLEARGFARAAALLPAGSGAGPRAPPPPRARPEA
ncbi:unnamed protein product [Prorocentrum cordatum]|uniref:Uncharacterized protein n=1 Tax=Prorocentrum cordatum TaxID=2364126 RepID=A0ABN9QPF5_9DINO|nr:unnamed protein product [Polarella glacialis]|mmetsp:Transcript_81121/g.211674  ORF Transcript_81121/g.211674 Transcript_81121/m.211674 type:complete len:100 (-) Transcript_81121:51-350(-)